jgi:radical SAM protein with 4Fe4S-binding SPASM domain
MNDNVCALLWTHAAVDMDGVIAPCCRFKPKEYNLPKIQEGFTAGWNGAVYDDIRRRMLSGEQLTNCFKCWEQEENTGSSMRTEYNNKYSEYINNPPQLKYLEIGFSTHCNLACRMCSEDYSSTWYKINNPGKRVDLGFNLSQEYFDQDLSQLDEIKIVGGEPMMAREHDEFVDKLIETHYNLSNLRITYHTNGTILPSKKVIDFWQKLGDIRLYFSIDGVGKINEYQRPGHNWQTIVNNIEYYKSLRNKLNLTLGTHTTVTALNIFHIADIYEWWQTTFKDNDRMTIDTAEGPEHLVISNMSDELKEKAKEYIEYRIFNVEHKNRLLKKIKQTSNKKFTIKDISHKEQKLDLYFKQNIRDIL